MRCTDRQPTNRTPQAWDVRAEHARRFRRLSAASLVLGFLGAIAALYVPFSGDQGWTVLKYALWSLSAGASLGLLCALIALRLEARSRVAVFLLVVSLSILAFFLLNP